MTVYNLLRKLEDTAFISISNHHVGVVYYEGTVKDVPMDFQYFAWSLTTSRPDINNLDSSVSKISITISPPIDEEEESGIYECRGESTASLL